jgi:tetratricopeptide (TPR) repeat protein
MLLRILRGTFVFACAISFAVLAPAFSPAPTTVLAQDDPESALGLTKEGIREYKKGNYEKAIQKLDEALAKNPNDEDARKMRDEIGAELAGDWVKGQIRDPNLNGRFQRLGKWTLLGRSDAKGRQDNAEEIKQFVDAYMGDADHARNMLRAARIRDAYGDFVVPYMQENYMHSENADARNRARILLGAIGAQAVNALVQVMQSSQMHDRQTAALALHDIGDSRALPALAQCFQDANEDAQVREACRMGIDAIRRTNPEKDKQVSNARDLWFMQAEGFYRNNAAGRQLRRQPAHRDVRREPELHDLALDARRRK